VPTLKGWRFPSEELWGVRRDPAYEWPRCGGFSFAKGRAVGLFPPPGLSERRHRGHARRRVTRDDFTPEMKVPGVPKLVPLGGPLDRVL